MSISIYYTASREQPLTKAEHVLVNELVARYRDLDGFIEEFGEEFDGESFHVYDPDDLLVARGKCFFQLPSAWRNREDAAPG